MPFLRTLITSVIFHFVALLVLNEMPAPERVKPLPVEVEILDAKSDQAKTFLRDNVDAPEDEKPNPKAKTLSEKTVRVDEETQAALSGLTQNNHGTSGRPGQKKAAKAPTEQNEPKPKTVGAKFLPMPEPLARDVGDGGVSSLADKLPDNVRVGKWTSMNSERFLFYSFFSRVEEQVYHRWASRVRERAARYDDRFLAKKEWVTKIEIILDKKGYFERAVLHESSGIQDFDRAALEAFREGAPYLNPPVEMLRDDGRIHLTYSVAVIWHPSVAIR